VKRFLSPTLQVTIGVVSLTISLVLVAHSLGLIADESKAALEARAKISENLAVQLAGSLNRDDLPAVNDTIASIVERNRDLRSVAIRDADGSIIAGSDDHASRWQSPENGKSTPTHLQIPLLIAGIQKGQIEIVFRPLDAGLFGGAVSPLVALVGFICVVGFAAYYVILRKALRELDPSRAVPERVKAAFDTLAEGILIIDDREFVLMANEAFVKRIYDGGEDIVGAEIGMLPWLATEPGRDQPELPWRSAVQNEGPILGVPMSIRGVAGDVRKLMVNATRIADKNGAVRGVIVTFDDVTLLHQTNEQLNHSMAKLRESERQISWQNQQLKVLASRDPLTGCLNRRAFFAEADAKLREAMVSQRPLAFLMLDADHFKIVNDRFGHAAGDRVLVGLAEVFLRICGGGGVVGRYGGEEFCVALSDRAGLDAERLAELIRLTVSQHEGWLPTGQRVTVSIGLAVRQGEATVEELIRRADEALYAAKAGGRNRVVAWPPLTIPSPATQPDASDVSMPTGHFSR
jgi:diguanylate cyclase (GGDEF)-like protein